MNWWYQYCDNRYTFELHACLFLFRGYHCDCILLSPSYDSRKAWRESVSSSLRPCLPSLPVSLADSDDCLSNTQRHKTQHVFPSSISADKSPSLPHLPFLQHSCNVFLQSSFFTLLTGKQKKACPQGARGCVSLCVSFVRTCVCVCGRTCRKACNISILDRK